jgi:ABC-2 type transport system permease protein
MKRALFITLNEVRLYLQDKGDLAFGLLLPIVTFALMYGAFGGNTMFEATASIVNEDGGPYAAQLIENIDSVDGISVEILTAAQADSRLERSDLLLALVIPEGFSRALELGGLSAYRPQLIFKQRGNGGQEGQILASIVRAVAGEMDQAFRARHQVNANLAGTALPLGRIETVVEQYLGDERASPAVAVAEEVVGANPDFISQFLPGIVTMYVLFALTLSARAIVEERRRGTLERLLTTRLNSGELFFGKFVASVARGFVQTVILLTLSYIVLRLFTPYSFMASLVICLVFAAAASALGMVIASIAPSEDSASWIAVFLTMFMVMMGGTFFPVEEGSVLALIGKASLNTYANRALQTIVTDRGSLGDVVFPVMVMGGVIVAGLVVSRFLFRAVPGGK